MGLSGHGFLNGLRHVGSLVYRARLACWGCFLGCPVVPLFPFWVGLGSLINPFKQKRAPFLSLGSWAGASGVCRLRRAAPYIGACLESYSRKPATVFCGLRGIRKARHQETFSPCKACLGFVRLLGSGSGFMVPNLKLSMSARCLCLWLPRPSRQPRKLWPPSRQAGFLEYLGCAASGVP